MTGGGAPGQIVPQPSLYLEPVKRLILRFVEQPGLPGPYHLHTEELECRELLVWSPGARFRWE